MPLADVKLWASRVSRKPAGDEISNSNFRKLEPKFRALNLQFQETELITNGRGEFQLDKTEPGEIWSFRVIDRQMYNYSFFADEISESTRETAPSNHVNIKIKTGILEIDLVPPLGSDDVFQGKRTIPAPGGMLQVDVSGAEDGWASLHLFSAADAARTLEIPGYFSDTLDRTSSCFVQVPGQKYQFDRALPEGDYILHASGPSARDVPFTIKKGAVTSVEFRVTGKGK